MDYEKKALGALDKILDAIYYEEGRLAIINKYGTFLSDEEKVQATQLITAQRTNLDRLFEIYKKDLDPLMTDICKNGEAMAPLVAKLVSAEMIAKQMVFQHEVEAMKNAAPASAEISSAAGVEENAVVVGTDVPAAVLTGVVAEAGDDATTTNEGATITNAVEEETTNTGAAVQADSSSVGEGVVAESTGTIPAADSPAGDTAGADTGSGETIAENADVPVTEPPVADASVTENAVVSENVSGENSVVDGTSTPFVLSPIDEDVAPVPTKEEVQAAEEGVAAADQQLQAIDGMKTDIMSDTSLSAEEKTEKLAQYTRMTDGAVRAILVTKAQCEKLLASRVTQKELLKPKEVQAEATGDVVAELPDFTAGEGASDAASTTDAVVEAAATEESSESFIPAIEGATEEQAAATAGGEVVLPTIENNAEVSSTTTETTAGGEGFLPMINEGSDASSTQADASEQVVLPSVEAPVAEETPTEPQNSQNELQIMIEQANALYKEGKTAEAQALFEKIGAMNKGPAADASNAEVADAANVLVKK